MRISERFVVARARYLPLALISSAAMAALPVDLDDERDPRSETLVRHEVGYGPKLLECRIAPDESLRCRLDEAPRLVECVWAEGGETRPLEAKVEKNAFVCAKAPAGDRLGQIWRILVTGSSGTVAEWVVEGRTAAQSQEAHLREMHYVKKARPFFDSYRLGLGAQGELPDAGLQVAAGVVGEAVREPFRVFAGLSRVWIRPVSGTDSFLPWVGLSYRFLASPSFVLEGGLAYRRFLRDEGVLTAAEILLQATYQAAWARASLTLSNRYPNGVTLKGAYGVEGGLEIRVWDPWWLRATGGLRLESWTWPSGTLHDQRPLEGQLALLWEKTF